MSRYPRTPENTAWERQPWKCPHCGQEGVQAGHWTHEKYCSNRDRRFWAKVDKGGGPDACWLWTGAKFKFTGRQRGYGRVAGSGPYTYSHRCAWIFTHGQIPEGKIVMHTCDVPLCCNPAHLRLGTDAENSADMYAKGRDRAAGERNFHAKLTDAQAAEIRRRFRRQSFHKSNAAELAAEFGVRKEVVHGIAVGRTYRNAA
jgi:HNH endonuclease